MTDIKPVTCNGYHFENNIQSFDDIPATITIPYIDDNLAKDKGWITTDNIRFSFDGSVVWLCPECAKRWRTEREGHIEDLLYSKNKLFVEYLGSTDNEHKDNIFKRLAILRLEFIKLSPVNEEWKMWNSVEENVELNV